MREGLQQIIARKRVDVAAKKLRVPLARLERLAARAVSPRDFAGALRAKGVSLIAELKKRSPSAGFLRAPYDVAWGARQYFEGGAAALSVLTEKNYFGGCLSHIQEAKQVCPLPVLRKDFLLEPYQILESRAAGADAVLLIAAALAPWELQRLIGMAHSSGMAALVEVHDAAELSRALAAGARAVGVNSRNLADLSMNPKIFKQLIPKIPKDRLAVAESGVKGPSDVKSLKRLGAKAVLVGESLLKQLDLSGAAQELAKAGQ